VRFWAKSRGLGWYAGACVAVSLAVVSVQQLALFAPNLLTGQMNQFSASYVLTAIPILFWTILVERSLCPYDGVSLRTREVAVLDLLAGLLPVLLCAIVLYSTMNPLLQGAARNFLFFFAMGTTALSVRRRYFAFALPALYLFACAVAGFSYASNVPKEWAFILGEWAPARDEYTIALSLLVACSFYVFRQGRRIVVA